MKYIDNDQSLTDAHIVPKAVGGRLTTVLCAGCNGPFGTRRDKWLGEYIRLFRLDQPTILHEKEQRGFFHVGDVKVGGRFDVAEDGAFRFRVRPDLTAPQSLEALPNQIKETITRSLSTDGPLEHRKRSVTITLPPSLLYENRDYVTLGFLTAAYLTLFRVFGYSWALQEHLDKVRRQIEVETLTILPRCHSAVMKGQTFEDPWIGFGDVNGELALLAGVSNRAVIFPPADAPDLYDRLPQETLEGSTLRIRRRIPIRPGHPQVTFPAGVMFDNRIVICPDVFLKGQHPLIYVPEKGDVQILQPTPEDEFQRLEREHPGGGISITSNLVPPERDTGR